MPLAAPIAKPSPWPWSTTGVASEWQPFAGKLVRAYPFWSFGSADIEDVRSGADGTANTNVWTSGPYGPALDFNGTQSHVATPSFDPPSRGMVVFLAKFDAGNGATPLHGSLDFESRVSGGNKLLHQFFNRTLAATNYDVPYGSYTLAGMGWDVATGNGPLYKDGALLQTKTGHNVDPGIISTLYIGSSGTQRYLDGVMDMVLILSDWPTQAEWDMLAADPFGWARQAASSEPQPVALSGSGTLPLTASGALRVAGALSGVGAVESSGSASLTVAQPLSATTTLTTDSSALLRAAAALSGDAALGYSSSGALRVGQPLSGVGAVTTTGAGSLGAGVSLSGVSSISAGGSGVLRAGHALSGAAQSEIGGSGTLAVGALLSGRTTLALSGSGVLAEPEIRYEYTTVTSLSAAATLTTSYPPAPLSGVSRMALAGSGYLTRGVTLVGYGSIALRTDVALGTEYALSTRRKVA